MSWTEDFWSWITAWVGSDLESSSDPLPLPVAPTPEPVDPTEQILERELLGLLRMRMEWTIENRSFLSGLAERYVAGEADGFVEEASGFLIEALFRFGSLTLAAAVSRRRREQGLPATGYSYLAEHYLRLKQYDFSSLEPPSRMPLHPPPARERLRVLSFLYSTPPFRANGYAVRTQSIYENTTLDVVPYGRIGYPWAANVLNDSRSHVVVSEGNVDYHHARGLVTRQTRAFENLGLAKHEILGLIARHRPDVIHAASNFTVGLPAMFAAREARVPFVYEMRGVWELTAGVGVEGWMHSERYALERRLETLLAQRAQRVITLTETQKAELTGRGIASDKIDVVPNCYHGGRSAKDRSPDLDSVLPRLGGKTVLGYIGSVANYEGLQLLVDVLDQSRDALPDVCLLVVGDGPYRAELEAHVEALDLADRVILTGHVSRDDADAAYELVDVCVLPRLDTPVAQLVSPLKLIEILAKGKVLLVSNVAAMAELVHTTSYGEMFHAGDVADLTRVLTRVVRTLPVLQTRYAEARHYVAQHATWSKGAAKWDACLKAAVQDWPETLTDATTCAQDALRTLTPARTELLEWPFVSLIRVARADLDPGPFELRLHASDPATRVVRAVAVESGTGMGRELALEPIPTDDGVPAFKLEGTVAESTALLFYLPAGNGPRTVARDWVLTRASAPEGTAEPIRLTSNRYPNAAAMVGKVARARSVFQLQSDYEGEVRFAVSVVPLGDAETGKGFTKMTFSEGLATRFQYSTVPAGESQTPIHTGVDGPTLVEFAPWQRPFQHQEQQLRLAAVGEHRTFPRSRYLDLRAERCNVLVVARVNENLIDGSFIWLKTLVGSLATQPEVDVYVLTTGILLPSSLNAALFSLPNVVKLDVEPPTDTSIDADLATQAMQFDRVSGGFDRIIVRGRGLAEHLTTSSIRSRGLLYAVGFIHPGNVRDGRCGDTDAVGLMSRYSALIFQSTITRDIFLRSRPDYSGECLVIPPSVDATDLAASEQAPLAGADIIPRGASVVVYAGKLIREYGVDVLLRSILDARQEPGSADLQLVVLGNKFDGADLAFRTEFERLADALGGALHWIPSASPAQVLAWVRRAEVVWGWRHADFETSHFEVSTKMVEALTCRTPILLYPSQSNTDLLGDDYPGFARSADEAGRALRAFLDAPPESASGTFERVGDRFVSTQTYAALTRSLEPRPRGARILIASHDFRFIEPIEARLLDEGYRVQRQFWKGHGTMVPLGEDMAPGALEIVHCEWCLGNAVHWSNHLPQGARLIIRFHSQELRTDYPFEVDWEAVERVVFISPEILRQACERFGIPEHKCLVIPISVPYRAPKFDDADLLRRRDVLGMVGITPWSKRPDLALQLFERLRVRYPSLHWVMKGKTPSAYAWMKGRTEELRDYNEFFRRVDALAREGAITMLGYDDQMEEFYSRVGWVFSTSDREGCHTAVAEGGRFGALPLMLAWPGADEVYPPQYVQPDLAGLEEFFDAGYARFADASREIQREFEGLFDSSAIHRAWTELLFPDTD